ncbi:MAG: pilin [Candidatus Moranbacteria bacterium]|nr:pilin [Candidatus Moranbacteria bacterium]
MKDIRKLCLVLSFMLLFAAPILVSAQSYSYQPMEKIPGYEAESSASGVDFYTYLNTIYKFGIAVVSICAMTMIIIGGYMYVASAGNNAGMEKAKKYITDAIIGLILALTAWLILYFINPDLTKMKPLTTGAGTPVGVGKTDGAGKPIPAGTEPQVSDSEFAKCDQDAKKQIESGGGVTVKNNTCSSQNQSGCTTVCQLPQNAIDGLKKVAAKCGAIIVSGGTEGGHSSHGPGKPNVDIRNTSDALGTCLKQGATDKSLNISCIASSNPPVYNYGCNFTDGSDHYHVVFN